MASATRQMTKANKDKRRSQERFKRLLRPWAREIVANYRLGDTSTTPGAKLEMQRALNIGYRAAAKDVLTIDIREYKQDEESFFTRVMRSIARRIDRLFSTRSDSQSTGITNTTNKIVARTSMVALEEQQTIRQARTALLRRLRSQAQRIAVTESQWVVEGTRQVSVLLVKDPLENSIEQIIQLYEAGDQTAAKRLSREVERLARLPLSTTQGKLLRMIEALRSAIVGPLQQAQRIVSLRRSARELDAKFKEWRTIGDGKVRDTHSNVDGQQRPIEAPFTLAGGLVQFPGDSSLGADSSEFINCRCAAIY